MNKKVLLLFVLVVIINGYFNSQIQLHYDEAYYWSWGQNLALSYYDHPPLIAYVIKIASFFGRSEFWVRFPALIATAATIVVLFKLSRRMFNLQVANITLILAVASPILEATFFIITPDSFLLLFWALTLYYFYIGIFENNTLSIYKAGLVSGIALLAKYTAVLIFPSLFIFLCIYRRDILLKKDIYLSFLIAVLLFLPVVFWNYQHNWISFIFQFQHGMELNNKLNILSFFDYLGGQVLISGPIIFFISFYFLFKYFKNNFKNVKLAFLLIPFIFILAFFGYRAIFQHMEANWPAPAYISIFIWLAYYLDRINNKIIYRSALVFILIVFIIVKFPTYFAPKKLRNNLPTVDAFFGFKELLVQLKPYLKPKINILACDYGNASQARYYLNLNNIYVLNNFKFAHMYQYWSPKTAIKQVIYICNNDDKENLKKLKQNFKSVNLLNIAKYSNSISDYKLYIYQVDN